MVNQYFYNRKRRCIIGCLILIMAVLTPCIYATGFSEDEVKAAFIFNFARFADWPEQKNEDVFLIGYVGERPLSGNLELLKGRKVHDKPIVIRPFDPEQAFQYELVFLTEAEFRQNPDILQNLKGHSILTVSDAPDFVSSGGMIGLIIVDKKVRFDINNAAAVEEGLKLSSQLLSLARTVKK